MMPNYIYQNYNSIYHECGHYLNIVDSAATEAIGIATGSGKNTDSEVNTISSITVLMTSGWFHCLRVQEARQRLNIESAIKWQAAQGAEGDAKQLQE